MKIFKIMLIFSLTALFLLPILAISAGFDLNQYPLPFIANSKFYGVIVVGDQAQADDIIGAVDIAISLQYLTREKITEPAVLASDIDSVKNQNAIVVGGPCANPAASELLGYPEDCMEGFWGKSAIQLFENRGYVQILVAGGSALDTRRASRILANYEENDDILNGTYVEVRRILGTGTSLNIEITD